VRLALPMRLPLRARLDVLESCRPRDAWQKAVLQPVQWVLKVQRVVPLEGLPALRQAQADESELLQAQSLRALLASRATAPRQVQEPVPWVPPQQWPPALQLRSALPQAQREPRAHLVSLRLAPRSPVEAPRARQVSSARPSLPHPSFLYPLWPPLPLALRLRLLPECSCAPSPRRPRGSSSSASSFP
jgi:hypothetical protein